MKQKNIILAGGTGFIGQELCNYFGKDNSIVVLTRQLPDEQRNTYGEAQIRTEAAKNIRYVQWDGQSEGAWMEEFNHADVVINLAGKSVNCRYNRENKKAILNSRTESTKAIGKAIQKAVHAPELWINASSATIYPHALDTARDESFTDFGNDFSVEVCKLWEKTFYQQRTPFTRKIALRMAITLGNGGVMIPYFNLLRFGLGGKQGSGNQMYSWVHAEDVCRMVEWLEEYKQLEGSFNCSSPNPVMNKTFMATLREITATKLGFPAFKWMLKIGAAIIRTETELILKSRWVVPTKILNTGFQFKYPILKQAFANIIENTSRSRYKLFYRHKI